MRQDSGFEGTAHHLAASMRRAGSTPLMPALSQIDPGRLDEAGALEMITALERVKRGAAAMQARLTTRVDELARARQQK